MGFVLFILCVQDLNDGSWHPGTSALYIRPNTVEAIGDFFPDPPGKTCTRIILRNGKAFVVVGTPDEIIEQLGRKR